MEKSQLKIIFLMAIFFSAVSSFGGTALENAITETLTKYVAEIPLEEDVSRIAIVPLNNDRTNEINDRLMTAIVQQNNSRVCRYTLIDRQQLGRLLTEANFQMSDIVDPKTAVRAGKIAGVDALLYGKIKRQRFSDNWADISLHLQMVKVQTAETFWAEDPNINFGNPPIKLDRNLILGAVVIFALIGLFWLRRKFQRQPKLRSQNSQNSQTSGQVEIIRRSEPKTEETQASSQRSTTTSSSPRVTRSEAKLKKSKIITPTPGVTIKR